jgi:hypothetical protein
MRTMDLILYMGVFGQLGLALAAVIGLALTQDRDRKQDQRKGKA